MKVLLVFAHPDQRLLNASLRDVAVGELEAQGHEVRISDLYAQGWKSEVDRADFPLLAPDARLKSSCREPATDSDGRAVQSLDRDAFWV